MTVSLNVSTSPAGCQHSRLTKPPHTMVGVVAEVVRRTWATLAGDCATNNKVRVGCNDLA
jgi:hypothetical protein